MSLKSFVNNKKEWDAFCEEIDLQISDLHKRLEQSESVVEIHQAQGGVRALRRLKYLRDKVNG
tara:strand:- start:128 stop:316 length:189 start_codon:yes stop_codon:yes gene_type:complete